MINYKIEEDFREEKLQFIEKKILLCKKIYKLLANICVGNRENEMYLFNLLSNFLKQVLKIHQ